MPRGSRDPTLDPSLRPNRAQGTLEDQLTQLREENAELDEKDRSITQALERNKKHLEHLQKHHEEQFDIIRSSCVAEIQRLKSEHEVELRELRAKIEDEQANDRTAVETTVMNMKVQSKDALQQAEERAEAARLEVEDIRQKLLAEKELQAKMREESDARLAVCRQEMAQEIMLVRVDAAADAEDALLEARRLVEAATGRVQEQRQRVTETKSETVTKLESTMALREAEMGATAREACAEYWRQVAVAERMVQTETRALRKLCIELESVTRVQRDEIQVQARLEAKTQIEAHMRQKRAINLQRKTQEWQHDAAVADLMRNSDERCKAYEGACRRRAGLQISAHRKAAERLALKMAQKAAHSFQVAKNAMDAKEHEKREAKEVEKKSAANPIGTQPTHTSTEAMKATRASGGIVGGILKHSHHAPSS